MARQFPAGFAFLSLCVSTLGFAQAPPLERAQDGREIRQDRRELRDDRRDATEITLLIARFDAARTAKNAKELEAIHKATQQAMQHEMRESHREVMQDRKELRRSRREQGRSGDEALMRGTPRAARAWRDDARDRRDDRRDVAVERASLEWRKRIAEEMSGLADRTDEVSLTRRRALMQEWADSAARELGQDRRELREDRRERREDVRQ